LSLLPLQAQQAMKRKEGIGVTSSKSQGSKGQDQGSPGTLPMASCMCVALAPVLGHILHMRAHVRTHVYTPVQLLQALRRLQLACRGVLLPLLDGGQGLHEPLLRQAARPRLLLGGAAHKHALRLGSKAVLFGMPRELFPAAVLQLALSSAHVCSVFEHPLLFAHTLKARHTLARAPTRVHTTKHIQAHKKYTHMRTHIHT